MKRILVVQTAFLGDVVLTTPLLRELRRTHPRAALDVVTTPMGAATLSGLDEIDGVIPFDKRGADRGPAGFLRLAARLRTARYDLAVAAQRSHRTALLIRLASVPVRVGFRGAPGAWSYTRSVPWTAERHAVHRYLSLAVPAGGDSDRADPAPFLSPLPTASESALRALRRHDRSPEDLLLIAPGSVWATKQWVPDGYASVARAVTRLGLRPALVGSPTERPLCDTVAAMSGGTVPVLAGEIGIPELIALVSMARAVVTNDSGPAHVASALGVPVVAIFGPTHPSFGYAPFGERVRVVEHPDLECRPCHHHGPETCPLGHFRCMREIADGDVLQALESLL